MQYIIVWFYVMALLSTPMGISYLVIAFDMEVQPLVTNNAARPLYSVCTYGVSAICIDVVSTFGTDVVRGPKLFAYRS